MRFARRIQAAFTLLEVMIAVIVVGIALMSLMELHHNNLRAVIAGQNLTRAAMLAQTVMSAAEVDRFPPVGETHGDFSQFYSGEFPTFRWERDVRDVPAFPDLRKIHVRVYYGNRSFDLTEFIHNPNPPPLPNTPETGDSSTEDSTQ